VSIFFRLMLSCMGRYQVSAVQTLDNETRKPFVKNMKSQIQDQGRPWKFAPRPNRSIQQGQLRWTRPLPDLAENLGFIFDQSSLSLSPEFTKERFLAEWLAKKRHWDSDSEGLSDADSSTSKGSEEKQPKRPGQLQLPPWMQTSPVALPPAQMCQFGVPPLTAELLRALSEEIIVFAKWVELRSSELEERQIVQQHLTNLVTKLWPSATIDVFGSTACGLALPSSDLDVVITGVPDFNPFSPLPHLVRLSQQLQCQGVIDCSIIPNTKVPLVKYCHPRANVWVDVNFTVLNSTKCIPVVKGYIEQYPLIRPIAIVLKTLLRQHGLHKPHEGGLGSYAIVLLLYSFMRLRVNMADVKNAANLGPLTVDFLRYFASHGTEYPFTPAADHPIDVTRPSNGRLEIWDPLDSGNNVAFSCRREEQIKTVFGIAVESLAWYSPRHCCSVLGSFIIANDPNLRMKVVSHSIEAEDPRDSGSPTHTDVSEESPSEEAGDSKEASQPTSPKRKSDEEPTVLGFRLADMKLGAVMGSDLESGLLLQYGSSRRTSFVEARGD
jgi:predicted nucleotidyltransferase